VDHRADPLVETLPAQTPPAETLTVVLFDDFELLDVAGPLEVFGGSGDRFSVTLVGPRPGPVTSAQGYEMVADLAYASAPPADIVLVPGGRGIRPAVDDGDLVAWLARWAAPAPYVASVCTGSALLAAAGLLDGYRATSNKRAFDWARSNGPRVEWVPEARWVEDRGRWTSSGVSAGMDMALALLAHLDGDDAALGVAQRMEYEWHRDAGRDPFAALYGLVEGA
jgi:transcriptional regulator GlxA family with amidase domain